MGFLGEQEQHGIHEVIDSFRFRDRVIVIEDDDEGVGNVLLNFGAQRTDNEIARTGIGATAQDGLSALADLRETAVDRRDQIFEEDLRVAIRGVELIPADRERRVLGKIGQERGFAVTGRRREDNELEMNMLTEKIN